MKRNGCSVRKHVADAPAAPIGEIGRLRYAKSDSAGVTSVTENVIVNGSLEDQIRRRFMVNTLRDDSTSIARIIVSQSASESGPLGPNDPVVALFIKMDDLKGSSKFSGELEQGTLREIFDFTAAARNVQCVVNGHGDDSENGL